MGESDNQGALPFSKRFKWGLLVGAVVGGLLAYSMGNERLAMAGWMLGGIVGAGILEEPDEELGPFYWVETLGFSLVVLVSENFLLASFCPLAESEMKIVLAVVGVIVLGTFLSYNDTQKIAYTLLLVFGIVGIITLATITVLVCPDGSQPNGPTSTPPSTPNGPDDTDELEPDWIFSIRLGENTTYEYYADNWTLYWMDGSTTAALDSPVHSETTRQLNIRRQPNGSWELTPGFGGPTMIVSEWLFVPRDVSREPQKQKDEYGELNIYNERNINRIEVRQPTVTYQLPPIGEQGIQQGDELETESETDDQSEPRVPNELYFIYGLILAFGGVLWGLDRRD